MSEYDRKLQAAMAELTRAGLPRSTADPWLTRLLRKVGFKPRPPYYVPFMRVVMASGFLFGSTWGAAMWLFLWRHQDMPLSRGIIIAAITGTLFGLFVAYLNGRARKRYGLSDWSSL